MIMRKTFTLLIALMALCVSSWATPTTITWNQTDVASIDVYSMDGSPATSVQRLKGIALTGTTSVTDDYAGFYTYESTTSISVSNGGTLTFSSGLYEIQSIVINYTNYYASATGWISGENTLTWTGSATHSVEMTNAYVNGITSIVFTVEAIPTTTVTWDQTDIETVSLNCENVDDVATTPSTYGITASLTRTSAGQYTYCQFSGREIWISDCGELTFTSSVGDIIGIVITSDNVYTSPYNYSADWAYDDVAHTLIWEGTASSQVTYSGGIDLNASSIEFTLASSTPAPVSSTITWDQSDVASIQIYQNNGYDEPQSITVKEISVTAAAPASGDYSQFYTYNNTSYLSVEVGGTLTFTAPEDNKLTRIIVSCGTTPTNPENVSAGWSWNDQTYKLVWTGDAASSVVLGCAGSTGEIYFGSITSVVFTVVEEPAPVDPTPANHEPVTWDFANDAELANISLTEFENYYFSYNSSYGSYHYGPNSIDLKGIVATISATTDGAYASFSDNNNYSIDLEAGGTLTFSTALGQFESIVVNTNGGSGRSSGDWAWNFEEHTLTWAGTPANSVVLDNIYVSNITSIVFTFVPNNPDPETIPGPSFKWEQRQVNHVRLIGNSNGNPETAPVIKNIITSITQTSNIGNCYFGYWGEKGKLNIGNCGYLTFQSLVGELRAIVITCSSVTTAEYLSAGWTYDGEAGTLTWVGEYALDEVALSGNINIDISEIEFYYTPASAPRLGEKFYDAAYQLYEITGAKTAKVAQQQWLSHTLNIPASVEDGGVTYYITEIDDYAFQNDLDLPNVMGGANIGRIGAHAFDGCLRMDEIDIESEVLDEIGEAAFKGCKLMQDIGFYTEQPPVLGDNAFEDTRYLNHILVPSGNLEAYQAATGWSAYASMIAAMYSLPSVGEQFFFHNQMTTGIYQVTYASNTRKEAKVLPYTAEVNAIYPITREGTLVIPEEADYIHNMYTITGIGANAYKDSTRFTTVMMPQAVKLIEEGAFRNCTGVEKVYFLWDDPTVVTWADADQGLDFKTAASGNTKIFVPENRLAAYQAWAPAWASCMIGADILDVTASEDPNNNLRYYHTFYDSEVDYLMPPSVWAHAGYVSGEAFILRPVAFDGEILPRGTAVVLESETPTYRLIPVGNDAPLYAGPNDLIGTDVAIPRTSVGNNGENVYVLGKQATIGDDLKVGMGMYRCTDEYLGAHTAYLISGPNSAPISFLFQPMAQECQFTPDMFPGQAEDRTVYEVSATVSVGGSGVYNTHVHSQVTGLTSTDEMVVATFNEGGYDGVFFVGTGSADVTYTENWFTEGGDGAEGGTSFCSTTHTIHYTVVEGTPEAYFSLENQPVTEYHAVQGGAFNPPSAVIIVKEKRMVGGFPQMQEMYISAMQMNFTSSN